MYGLLARQRRQCTDDKTGEGLGTKFWKCTLPRACGVSGQWGAIRPGSHTNLSFREWVVSTHGMFCGEQTHTYQKERSKCLSDNISLYLITGHHHYIIHILKILYLMKSIIILYHSILLIIYSNRIIILYKTKLYYQKHNALSCYLTSI